MIPTLAYGLRDAVPDTAIAAWGARAIIGQDGHVDIPFDRQDMVGDSTAMRFALEAIPPGRLREIIQSKLANREILTREAERVTLFDNGQITVVANSNASAGYLYIAAYLNGDTTCE